VFSGNRRKRALVVGGVGLLITAALYVILLNVGRPAHGQRVPFSDFLRHVENDRVTDVIIADETITATLRGGQRINTTAPPGFLVGNSTFVADLMHRSIRVDVNASTAPSAMDAATILFGLALFGAVGFIVFRTAAGRIPSIESKTKVAERGTAPVMFQDVAGVDEAKDEVKEIVDFLREPQRFAAVGGRIPKGVLLVGPPGTGKTLLARSIAGEAGVPFLFASGADFVEMYAGVGAARVRRLFRDARRHKSCIVFIDELDAVGRSRGGNSLSHEEREQTLNQLLVEMDGFEAHQGTVVVAATNRQDILDPALLRPGRFDRQVVVGRPDIKGREAILRVHTKKISLSPDVDLRAIARGTPGFSGAELANLVNEGALLAARGRRTFVTNFDLEAARDKVLMGVERRSLVLSDQERINCAYHEAGHAVIAAVLPHADPLHKVTIIPRGRAMGVTMQLPEADRHTYTKIYLETQVAVLMGGRVAEELFMGHITSGAANDIERATDIAERMVCEFGMSPLGPLAFRRPSAQESEQPVVVSEETARRVDEEVRRIVMNAYEESGRLLDRYRAAVCAVAEALLEVESLEADEIRRVLGAHGVAMPAARPTPSSVPPSRAAAQSF
jgi:cell division protease FtsH